MSTNKILSKFHQRLRQLHDSEHASFQATLRDFWDFFDNEPTLTRIRETAIRNIPKLDELVEHRMFGSNTMQQHSSEYWNAVTFELLRKIAYLEHGNFRAAVRGSILPKEFPSYNYPDSTKLDNEEIKVFKQNYLYRLSNFVENQLETTIIDEEKQSEIENRLIRYKHRCEWFENERLYEIFTVETDTKSRKAEKQLALDLYAYLYEHGIDFYIEPKSLRGAIDLISIQDPDDPLLADTKIFDGVDRSKAYICSGFNQIYTYTKQYNQPSGFLIIYKVTDIDLEFDLPINQNNLGYFYFNQKTIYFLTIDIYPHSKPVSQRKNLKANRISASDLVRYIENSD
jgi:hypothetical protein